MKIPDARGFTMVELLVAMSISLLFFSAITGLLINSLKSAQVISDELEGLSGARRAGNAFLSEARVAAYSSAGDYPLQTVSSSEIVFFANIDKDPAIERVRYFLDGTDLKKGVTKPTGNPPIYATSAENVMILLSGVRLNGLPLLTYFAVGTDAPLADPIDLTAVRLVNIHLRVDKNPTKSPVAWSVDARAEFRNLEK